MSDLSDVANSLLALCVSVLYPAGGSNKIVASPTIGIPVRTYVGWPLKSQLDADLAATPPICHLSVYPRPQERNTTRYLSRYRELALNSATLTLSAAGQTVTIGGTIPAPTNVHNLAVFVNGAPYVYQAQPSDTLATIAVALAGLIPGATASGPVVTVPSSAILGAVRVGVFGTSGRAVRNTQRVFQIGIWCATPAQRDLIAQAVDPVLAATPFIRMPDGSFGKLEYRGSPESDQFEKSMLYRRDLLYSVDYSTLQTVNVPQIVATELQIQAAVAGQPPYETVATEFS